MSFKEIFKVLDAIVFTKKTRHLKDVEKFVLWAAWQGQTYDEMATASNYCYTPSYLKQGIGPRLWKLISEVLGEEVSKTNFRVALERQAQLAGALQTQEPVYARLIGNRCTDWGEEKLSLINALPVTNSQEYSFGYNLRSADCIYSIKDLPALNTRKIEPALIEGAVETVNGLKSDLEKPFPEQSQYLRQWIAPQLIQLNAGTQSRKQTNQQTIDDYAEQMAEELWNWEREPLPVVFDNGESLFPGDGHHRVIAAIAAGVSKILVEIRLGTMRDAQFYSCSANKHHGLPRTNADKRNQVELLLSDPEWQQMSDRAIAQHCGVSAPFIGKIRAELAEKGTINISIERLDKSGRKINTANIGTKPKAKKTKASPPEKQLDSQPEMLSTPAKSEQLKPVSVPQKPTHLRAKATVLIALDDCTEEELKEIYLQIRLRLERIAQSKSLP